MPLSIRVLQYALLPPIVANPFPARHFAVATIPYLPFPDRPGFSAIRHKTMKRNPKNAHRNAHWILPANGPVNLPIQALLSRHRENLATLTSLSAPDPELVSVSWNRRKEAFRRMSQIGRSIFTTPLFRSQLRRTPNSTIHRKLSPPPANHA